ncbi:MAG: NAD-glutamate dehydrogenase [Alphaproteobacteria bacterium]|nr:NAD-glutamate dehydrogenase [Alphaproteobacteria bacterium]
MTIQATKKLKTATKKILTNTNKKLASQLLDVFIEKIPADDLSRVSPENLAYTVDCHIELSQVRPSNDIGINIYTPNIKKHGWDDKRTIIDIVNDDMAFLVDSVVAEVIRQNYEITVFIHPITHVSMDTKKKPKSFSVAPTDKTHAQSHIHIELSKTISKEQCEELEMGLRNVLRDARYANTDWLAIREKLTDAKDVLTSSPKRFAKQYISECQSFLDYLYNDNFTLLGYREYKITKKDDGVKSSVVKGSSLGLLRDEIKPVYINEARKALTEAQQQIRVAQSPLTISKVNKPSTVHRRVPLDAIAVKKFDAKGQVVGEILFIGLFTSVTYSRSVGDIPFLRMKVDKVIEKAKFLQASHNHKALKHILEKYPRDEILQMSEESLFKHAISILGLQKRPQIALYTRTDPFSRYISCLVYVPREKYDTRLRLRFTNVIESFLGGKCTNFQVLQDDSPLARVIFQIDINSLSKAPSFKVKELQQALRDVGELWPDQLHKIIEKNVKENSAKELYSKRYCSAFPTSYQERNNVKSALYDIEKIESVLAEKQIDLELYEDGGDIGLKIYHADHPLALSDVLPILENMGLRVVTERPAEVKPADLNQNIWVHDFFLETADGSSSVDIKKSKVPFETVFKKTWQKEVENDSLNKLAFMAQMNWRDIMILRTYVHYLRQTGYPFSLPYMEGAVTSYPSIGKLIVSLFKEKFDPKKKSRKTKDIEKKIKIALENVEALDHDRILRSIVTIMNATLRTNFYQNNDQGEPKSYLSIKLESRDIPELPEPKPYKEIFVYSARVEGVHLRGDKIARGGLRWSDRHEDFRTEVLGLMKAQQVKNAVIIPMGAKGGFVVKNPPTIGGRAAFLEEGIECYKTFIRGLLDITDNRKGTKIIAPKDVVRHDEEDPYLVVAADKGTATFSDIANGLSEEYEFWLGDAFASGGSAGYDHKKMGITARGAWESVKRHFRELNHDTQSEEFDAIGVGDMAGDVFGNGMLLSEHIRLIGAFNHLHIFCDPDPDAAVTYKERKRLFDNVKGWDAYNKKLLSKGGRIYSRSDKKLELTPEIKKRFDIAEDSCTPNQLIRFMLRARTDLMWFGGIGTYIKGKDETHDSVGDKGNDILRINAQDVHAKVIGEGANLAITQQARIEYAQGGGCCNADYIDNAGGVASSDDEVNIKILLVDVMSQTKHNMDIKKRNKLLESMTDDVAQHVLRNNYQQAQGISLMELQAPENLGQQIALISYLEQHANLNRELEFLPDDEELKRRLASGKGLTRPELSVLQSYAKISYTEALLNSDIVDSKAMEERLLRYFPKKLSKSYAKEILGHRLKDEIIATTLANGIVNRMGPSFLMDRMNKCGASAEEVAKAYIIVREAFGLRDLWNHIESLDGTVPAAVQLNALRETARMIERAVTWFLTRFGRKLDINRDIASFEDGIEAVKKHMNDVVPADLLKTIKDLTNNGVQNGLPKALSHDISLMPILGSACDIIRISVDNKFDIRLTASIYFELGQQFHLDWMRQKARYMPADNHWSSQALEGLVDQLYTCQANLTIRILKDMSKEIKSIEKNGTSKRHKIVESWIDSRGSQAKLLQPLFDELKRSSTLDMSMIIIAEQRLRNLYGG